MDELLTKEEGRIVTYRINNIDQLIHIQETLDEEVMVCTMKFDEYMNLAGKIIDSMKLKVV